MNIREPVTFKAACIIESDYVYIAAKPDVFDAEEEFTRLFFYDAQNKSAPWLHHDLPDWSVVSVCVIKKTVTTPRMYAALSKIGEVEFIWPTGKSFETIEGAGLKRTKLPIFGYVNAITEIDGSLYVCGSGGQIYQRKADGWVHIAESLKIPAEPPHAGAVTISKDFGKNEFIGMCGFSSNDLYVVGSDGAIYHFNGSRWQICDAPIDETLNAVVCDADGTVWACGSKGALFHGNFRNGFQKISAHCENLIFTSIGLLNGVVYLASNEGLFFFNKILKSIEKVQIGLEPLLQDTDLLAVAGGVLWSFGFKDMAYFDGKKWTRVNHPDNPVAA